MYSVSEEVGKEDDRTGCATKGGRKKGRSSEPSTMSNSTSTTNSFSFRPLCLSLQRILAWNTFVFSTSTKLRGSRTNDTSSATRRHSASDFNHFPPLARLPNLETPASSGYGVACTNIAHRWAWIASDIRRVRDLVLGRVWLWTKGQELTSWASSNPTRVRLWNLRLHEMLLSRSGHLQPFINRQLCLRASCLKDHQVHLPRAPCICKIASRHSLHGQRIK